MNVPTIGGARGIFEIFVPGVFLLLNMGYFAYSLPSVDQNTKNVIVSTAANPTSALIVVVSFGYLVGILLRLLRTDLLDRVSSGLNRLLKPNWLLRVLKSKDDRVWATDKFPYIAWVGRSCVAYLPPEAKAFHEKVWEPRAIPDRQNKQFFNFVKTVVVCNDPRAATEIYAAEAMSRYVACMFFALLFAFGLLLGLRLSGQVQLASDLVLITYGIALAVIVKEFRSTRIKEVEAVFATSFRNRVLFESGLVTSGAGPSIAPSTSKGRLRRFLG
jgi:hypothetical protein